MIFVIIYRKHSLIIKFKLKNNRLNNRNYSKCSIHNNSNNKIQFIKVLDKIRKFKKYRINLLPRHMKLKIHWLEIVLNGQD